MKGHYELYNDFIQQQLRNLRHKFSIGMEESWTLLSTIRSFVSQQNIRTDKLPRLRSPLGM